MVPEEDVAALYIAMFNRAPEGEGLESWYKAALENDWGLAELAESMLLAAQQVVSSNVDYMLFYPQYVEINPNDPNNVRDIIETVYETLFDKNYINDPEGIDGWVYNVTSGNQSLGQAIASIEIVAKDIALGKIPADADTFKAAKTFLSRIDAALIVAEYINTFDEDFSKFQNYILLVNDDPESLTFLENKLKNDLGVVDDNNQQITDDNQQILDDNNQTVIDDNNQQITDNNANCSFSFEMNNPLYEVPQDKMYVYSALNSGFKWDMNTILYSFPEQIPFSYYYLDLSEYFSKNSLESTWEPLNDIEKNWVREIFNNISKLVNLSFEEVNDQNGQIRFNKVYFDISDYGGFSFYPNCYLEEGGDVFLNSNYFNDQNYYDKWKKSIILHEIGHALGLKHPFEGSSTLPQNEDNSLYSVMSYTDYRHLVVYFDKNNISISYFSDAYPISFQLYDVLTLQALYGHNLSYASGDDIYNLSDLFDKHVYMTLWDSGGIDTLDVSNTTYPSYINLTDGSFSSVSYHSLETQRDEIVDYLNSIDYSTDWIYDFFNDSYLQENLYTGENNLAIAYGTVIENVKTGAGDDIIWDNQASNYIYTGEGNDKIYLGSGGNDFVDGGSGYDVIILNGNSSDYNLEQDNDYTVLTNGLEEISFVNVEEIQFTDTNIVV